MLNNHYDQDNRRAANGDDLALGGWAGRKNCKNNSFELDEKELNCDKSRGQTTNQIEEERGGYHSVGEKPVRSPRHVLRISRARDEPSFFPQGK